MDIQNYYNLMASTVSKHAGDPDFQPFFAAMQKLCLQGMGIGLDGQVERSGEEQSLSYVREALRNRTSSGIVFDVGANKGQFATLAAAIFEDATLYSFEPTAASFKSLVATAARIGERCRTFNFGLSDREGAVAIFKDAEGSGLNSVYRRRLDHYGIVMDKTETIALKTVDGFCAEQGIAAIDLLKLDVEGHELAVLQGAKTMIANGRIRFIQFEFGGTNIDSRTYFQDFWYFLENYTLSRITPRGLTPITEYNEGCEIFWGQNFLAELKG